MMTFDFFSRSSFFAYLPLRGCITTGKNPPDRFVGIWLSDTSPFVQEEDLLDPQDNDEVVAILQASGTLVAMTVKNF